VLEFLIRTPQQLMLSVPIAQCRQLGFIRDVMNTDNLRVSDETIEYGAYALTMRTALLTLLSLLLCGCGAVAVGPAQPPAESRVVQLLEHGRHSTLLLTAADQTRLRYAYADWSWYVDEDAGVRTGLAAMLRDSRAALGRQQLPPARPDENLASVVGVGIAKAHVFQVDASKVDDLLASLEQLYHASADQPYHSGTRNLSFVEHPQPYRFSQNSNHMVADWLGELGVSVTGNPAVGRWHIDPPQ